MVGAADARVMGALGAAAPDSGLAIADMPSLAVAGWPDCAFCLNSSRLP
jgi:hypothetical protein